VLDPRPRLARTFGVRLLLSAVLAAAACGNGKPATRNEPRAPAPAVTVQLGDQLVTIAIDGDRIAAVGPAAAGGASAGWVMPSVIDSHVHLAYWPIADRLADHGVAAAVDLAAPLDRLDALRPPAAPVRVILAGPMITQPHGYPLDQWGPDGFGIGCADRTCLEKTIAQLAAIPEVDVIKVPIAEDGLDPALLPALVSLAHDAKLRVAAHALSDAEAALAAKAGCDLLAHTPVDRLSDATVAAWKGKAVISTLAAFGAGVDAVDNLRRLRQAGVTVLYGTDLGNQRDDGPSPDEIALLGKAGLDAPAILDAMTTTPARYWDIPLGIGAGKEASFVIVDRDPREDATAILHRRAVYLKGKLR
jgi:imidazolonepropionase-like amidohydrolase